MDRNVRVVNSGSKCGNERIAVIAVLVKKKMVFFKAKCT